MACEYLILLKSLPCAGFFGLIQSAMVIFGTDGKRF